MRGIALLAGLPLLLAACEQEPRLSGIREDPRAILDRPPEVTAPLGAKPISLPAPVNHAEWTHRGGTPSHQIRHPALDAELELAWSAPIGKGNDRRHRITADPVISQGRIFTLDSRATVTATSVSGETIWQRDLTPRGDDEDDATGGGLAVAGGRLFVTTGFGALTALDVATGAEIWSQQLGAVAAGSPTVVGNLVYVVSGDSQAWVIDTRDGRVQWRLSGAPSVASVVGGPSPAVTSRAAIFPFPSSELQATLPRGGLRLWSAFITGRRLGPAYANIEDITADPVIVGRRVYTANASGRTVALDLNSGERIWTAEFGAMGPFWVEGGSIFMLSDQGDLLRVDAGTGRLIWTVDLPYFENRRVKRQKDIYTHFGPMLAGGRVLVASDDGELRAYNPVDGALLSETKMPDGAATNMAVVGGTLYLVSQDGKLLAFR
ncbi:MAG: PQQ-binding-like beta-propeller repeat protein [Rhodobacteraceae bacterium]|nr:PQQ-binding-like beta-propeller repeat protein [Paracoccaceae bacterium]